MVDGNFDFHSVVVFCCYSTGELWMVDPATDRKKYDIGEWEESYWRYSEIEEDFVRYFLVTDPRGA